jgi:hypothetical protein
VKLRFPYRWRPRSRRSDVRAVCTDASAVRGELEAQLDALEAEGWSEHELEALREFVANDGPAVTADRAFKERLRMDLWWMIVTRISSIGSGSQSG